MRHFQPLLTRTQLGARVRCKFFTIKQIRVGILHVSILLYSSLREAVEETHPSRERDDDGAPVGH